jgi:hypothetical protein
MLLLATSASADVTGNLVTGSGGAMTITLTSITFNTDPSADPPGPPWNAEVASGTSLKFASCPSGVLGTAGCLDAAPFSAAEAVEVANGNPINLGGGLGPNNPFLQFAGNGTTHATILYTLTGLGPGSSDTNCAALTPGQSCSLFAGSPIILFDTGVSTTASLNGFGTVTDGAGTNTWIGGFSAVYAGLTPEQIQLFFCPSGTCTPADFASGRSISSSQSGDFVASTNNNPPVPEPGSLLLLGTGLLSVSGLIRRKWAK